MESTKRVMTINDEQEFIELVIAFAEKKSMTISNITDSIQKVIAHMNNNAILENRDR